jgi:hypothetical protein
VQNVLAYFLGLVLGGEAEDGGHDVKIGWVMPETGTRKLREKREEGNGMTYTPS